MNSAIPERIRDQMKKIFFYIASLPLRFLCRFAELRDGPPAGRKCLSSSLPSAYPSSRVAELGNSLG
jgi:hypothetical protein